MLIVNLIHTILACSYDKDESCWNRYEKCSDDIECYPKRGNRFGRAKRCYPERPDMCDDRRGCSGGRDDGCWDYPKFSVDRRRHIQDDVENCLMRGDDCREDYGFNSMGYLNSKVGGDCSPAYNDGCRDFNIRYPNRGCGLLPVEDVCHIRERRCGNDCNPRVTCEWLTNRPNHELSCFEGQRVLKKLSDGCKVYPGCCVVHKNQKTS